MHVLVLPSFYPQDDNPNKGIFFKEQIDYLSKCGIKIGIVYREDRSIREITISKLKRFHFQTIEYKDGKINGFIKHGWNLIPHKFSLGIWNWILDTVILGKKYIEIFGKPDIIHAHNACYAGYSAMILSKMYNIPYVVTEHFSGHFNNNIKYFDKIYLKKVYSYSKVNISVSSELKRLLVDKYMIDIDKIKIIPNMVNCSFSNYKPKLVSYNTFYFIAICNLIEIKNIDILIKAFAKSFKGNAHIHLNIGGSGDKQSKLIQLVETLHLKNQITFLGNLSREQVRDNLHSANVLVLPSKYETFGVVLIESLSTGTPVIGTNSGGPIDIIADNTGLLVEPNNVEELSKALENIYTNYYKYDGYYISEYARDNFSKEKVGQKIISLYNNILDAN